MKQLEFRLALIALVSLSITVFLGKSYETLLRGIDSNIHAKAALDVTADGFLPKLPMKSEADGGEVFNDHPFFPFWANGKIMRVLGPSAWSARILSAVFSVGCVLLTLGLGTLLHSLFFGFLAAFIFLTTRDIVLTGATVSLDPALMFFILASFIFWKKEKWLGVSLSVGIGLWMKTPVVLLIYPTALLDSWLRKKKIISKMIPSVCLALAIGSFVWIATGLLGGWDLVLDYWNRQVFGTAVGGRNQGHWSDPLMFFSFVKHGFIPSLPLLIFAGIKIYRERSWKLPAISVSLIAVGWVAVCISLIKFRMAYYYNPVFPFLAYLAAYAIYDKLKKYEKQIYMGFSAGVPVLLAVLVCCPISFGPETFVALKRFIPFIQSYGTCQDEILLVSGGEPVGSSHDYRLVLKFYTGKKVNVVECREANEKLRQHLSEWVLISKENFNQCLSLELQMHYSHQLKVGTQYLLSTLLPMGQETDLTLLERELKPTVDCKPPEYPQDRYHHYDASSQ